MLFSINIKEGVFIRAVKGLIDTDATNYNLDIKIQSADVLTSESLSDSVSTSLVVNGGNVFSWITPNNGFGGRISKNRTYYLKLVITNITGGSYMYMNDPVIELV